MKGFTLCAVLLALAFQVLLMAGTDGPAIEQSFLVAKDRAERENKPYIVQFTAEWSTAGKWMEETTLQDPEVVGRLKGEFVFVRVNIEEFEGETLKQYYEIHNLPSFLFFTPSHLLAARAEGSLSSDRILELMDQCASADGQGIAYRPDDRSSFNKPVAAERAGDRPEGGVKAEEDPAGNPGDEIETRASFRVQIGAYVNLDNARAKEDDLQRKVGQPCTIISTNTHDTGQIHRLYLGNFPTREEAETFLRSWKAMGGGGIVKKVSLSEKI